MRGGYLLTLWPYRTERQEGAKAETCDCQPVHEAYFIERESKPQMTHQPLKVTEKLALQRNLSSYIGCSSFYNVLVQLVAESADSH